jgi:hypothetical protein
MTQPIYKYAVSVSEYVTSIVGLLVEVNWSEFGRKR